MSESLLTVILEKEKDTKNTFRYKADTENATEPLPLDTVYLQKWAANKIGNPQAIKITVEPA